jgi:hypothetical protein
MTTVEHLLLGMAGGALALLILLVGHVGWIARSAERTARAAERIATAATEEGGAR